MSRVRQLMQHLRAWQAVEDWRLPEDTELPGLRGRGCEWRLQGWKRLVGTHLREIRRSLSGFDTGVRLRKHFPLFDNQCRKTGIWPLFRSPRRPWNSWNRSRKRKEPWRARKQWVYRALPPQKLLGLAQVQILVSWVLEQLLSWAFSGDSGITWSYSWRPASSSGSLLGWVDSLSSWVASFSFCLEYRVSQEMIFCSPVWCLRSISMSLHGARLVSIYLPGQDARVIYGRPRRQSYASQLYFRKVWRWPLVPSTQGQRM